MNYYPGYRSCSITEHVAREIGTSVALEEAMAELQLLGVQWLRRAYQRGMTIHIKEQVG